MDICTDIFHCTSDSVYLKWTLLHPQNLLCLLNALWVNPFPPSSKSGIRISSLTLPSLLITTFNKVPLILPLKTFQILSSCSLVLVAFCPCHYGICCLLLQQPPYCSSVFLPGLALLCSTFHVVVRVGKY